LAARPISLLYFGTSGPLLISKRAAAYTFLILSYTPILFLEIYIHDISPRMPVFKRQLKFSRFVDK